jgi:hypothetical protein
LHAFTWEWIKCIPIWNCLNDDFQKGKLMESKVVFL